MKHLSETVLLSASIPPHTTVAPPTHAATGPITFSGNSADADSEVKTGAAPEPGSRRASLARALARAQSNGVIRPLLKPIPMRSKDGKVDKSHPVKVQAKTGTLLFVSALAGYARAPDGTELAFAFFAANEGKRSRVDRSSGENVPGSRSWNKRAKRLQQALIERWAVTYGG